MKLVYPIILTPYEDRSGGYVVTAPDMPGLVTGGDTLAEALDMARDAASGWVLTELEEGRHEPHASNIADVKPDEPDGIVTLISLDMDAYAEKYGKKSVRKNVTIPAWLDTFGEQQGINYSQVLREGLENRYRELQEA
ncbi:type II toxin-antitoxin system HicB family antitoxin [Bifidobacterium sp. SO4]|uniref:type II toxin-antitoxin system HicB family antitoxin n=1 Tax=Bifidobacterium sp. SO4 TaxID=2809030 RepID=UPI001BDD52B5|nr:type II toxin-antitoxin system HicB family antitoxin [Bifidobacterium sp. SO4]